MTHVQGSFWDSLNFRRMLSFAMPLSVAVFFQWFLVQGYRFVLEPYISLEMLGGFLMAFTFSGRFFNAVEKIINVVLLPDLYTAKDKPSAWKVFFIKCSVVYVTLFVVLALSVRLLFNFLIGSEYQFAAAFLFAGLAYDFLKTVLNAVFQLYLAQEKTWMQLIVSICSACGLVLVLVVGLSAGLSLELLQYAFPCVLIVAVIAGLALSRRQFCR
jgi:O-antigen/teichoic acid export membrane protein